MKFINIGFGNMVSSGRVLTVVSPESAPIKRIVQEMGIDLHLQHLPLMAGSVLAVQLSKHAPLRKIFV